jgi:hypothetical protein
MHVEHKIYASPQQRIDHLMRVPADTCELSGKELGVNANFQGIVFPLDGLLFVS